MRGVKRDYIDEIIKQGAFVVKPTPIVTPVPELVPEPVIETSIEDEAARLERRWRELPDSVIPAAPEYSEEVADTDGRELTRGDTVECVVVSYSAADPTGHGRPGIGLARILGGGPRKKKGEKRTDGLLIREKNIVTEGTISVGTKIKGCLAPAESDAHRFSLVEIEIYKD
jgi:hypothetical protein